MSHPRTLIHGAASRAAKLAAVLTVATIGLGACGGTTTEPATTQTRQTNQTSQPGSHSAPGASAKAASGDPLKITCPTGKVNGGGSSAQDLAMQTLATVYNQACASKGSQVVYTKSGSGQGIKDFYNGQLQFAGSDSALKSTANSDGVIESDKVNRRCAGNPGWNLPLIVGPVAFAYNLDGVANLVLTPEVITQIFLGKITAWNAPEIAKVNPGVALPADKIAVFYRNDESGTTENVSKYLAAAAPQVMKTEPSKKYFGTAGEGKKGSQGVADAVKATKGGFGYMEWKYAKDAQLGSAAIDSGQGAVPLTAESAGKAMSVAEISGAGTDLQMKLKYTDLGAGVYPMVMVTYEIVCSAGLSESEQALLKDFLTFASSTQAQASLEAQGYAPLPWQVQIKVAKAISELT